MSKGPQKVRNAASSVEQEATLLLRKAYGLTQDSAAWENRDLLKQARDYAAAMNRLSRVRTRV